MSGRFARARVVATLLLVGSGLVMRPSASQHKEPDVYDAHQMAVATDRVVLGRVIEVKDGVKKHTVGKRTIELPARIVKIQVTESFGISPPPSEVEVAVYAPLVEPAKDEIGLWFLKRASEAGFDSPVGDYAGYFRVSPDPKDPSHRVVISALSNRGLWSKEKPFWQSFKPEFSDAVKRQLSAKWPARANGVIASVNRPCTPDPVPIELMLAVAAARFPNR